jgi:hypothetical protein
LMNRIVDKLTSLETRVGMLEAVGPEGEAVVITGLLPSGPVGIGSEFRVSGRNFGLPSTNVVTLDNIQVTQFKSGSSDTQLIFDIPNLQGVTQQGKVVTLTVSNPVGFASTSLVVVPAVPTTPSGSLFVTLKQPPADPQLLAGQSYVFVFAVQAITNMEEAYTLAPQVSTGWPAQIVDQNGINISPAEITIPKSDPPDGTTRDVRVRLTIPSGAGNGATAQLKLVVASKRNPLALTKTSGGDTVTVGAPPPPPQKIVVSFSNVLSPNGVTPAFRNEQGVVVIPVAGTQYRADFSVLIEEVDAGASAQNPTKFNLALNPAPGADWTASIAGATVIDAAAPHQNRLVMVALSGAAGATPSNLTLKVTKANDATVFGQFSQPIKLGP